MSTQSAHLKAAVAANVSSVQSAASNDSALVLTSVEPLVSFSASSSTTSCARAPVIDKNDSVCSQP